MSLQLFDTAPNFQAETTEGRIDFYDYLGEDWGLLISSPKTFTPILGLELAHIAERRTEFDSRSVKIASVTVEPLDTHVKWKLELEEWLGKPLDFPLVADPDREVSLLYKMLHADAADNRAARAAYLIAPDRTVNFVATYSAATARNFDEIIRVIDSLQVQQSNGNRVGTPVGWQPGDDLVIVPRVSDEEARTAFPQGWDAVRPWLRVLPQPENER
jgi:alkyl hydroperoxide reductase subunit AhpC